MGKIASTTDLKNAIQLLEVEQRAQGVELKVQYAEAYKSFKPLNLIKDTLKGVVSSPGIIENIIVGGIGLATGYLTRRVVVGTSTNIFRKLLGSTLQFGASSLVTQNASPLINAGKLISKLFFKKKKNSNR
jgi:hypothetical protein